MNVLPPQAAPAASTCSTTGPSEGAAGDTAGFQRMLADHLRPGGATTPTCDDAAADPTDGEAAGEGEGDAPERESGAVAAAVHAAVAAWRADPGDVALGAHLRQMLAGTVHETTAVTSAATTTTTEPTVTSTPVGAEVPAATLATIPGSTAPSGVAVEAAPPADAAPPEVTSAATTTTTVAVEEGEPVAPAAATSRETAGPAAGTARPDGAPAPTPAPAPTDAPTIAATTEPVDAAGTVSHRPGTVDRDRVPETPARRVEATVATHEAAGESAEVAAGRAEAPASAPRAAAPAATSAAALDRVLRAVEALEHAPPPRRLSIEVEGLQMTVAMQGDEVTVAVRGGVDQLGPGWQRDLASALRGRGMDLSADTGTPRDQGEQRRHSGGRGDDQTPSSPFPQPHRRTAEPAGLRL